MKVHDIITDCSVFVVNNELNHSKLVKTSTYSWVGVWFANNMNDLDEFIDYAVRHQIPYTIFDMRLSSKETSYIYNCIGTTCELVVSRDGSIIIDDFNVATDWYNNITAARINEINLLEIT